MLKRHEIQVLRKAGREQAEVARLAGVWKRSVRRMEAAPAVTEGDTAAERLRRQIGQPAKAQPFRKFALELLAQEPDLLTLEVTRWAREAGYSGGKSSFDEMVASVRPKPVRLLVRFEGLPGEFSQRDFGHIEVRFTDGTKKRIDFFASRLKYWRWVEVTLVPDERWSRWCGRWWRTLRRRGTSRC